jgi:hypothetical protein
MLLTYTSRVLGDTCDSIELPKQIRAVLQKDFAGWKVVTSELLVSPDDRQLWAEQYSDECPGIISGHFRGRQIEYVVNLIRGAYSTLEQQIVFFELLRDQFRKVILSPPSHVGVVTVLRKFEPGLYRSAETDRAVKISFDTIGISEIEGGTVVLYWDGKRFLHIVTSV